MNEFHVTVSWTGNLGTGTSGVRDFSRDHDISFPDVPTLAPLLGSAAPQFRGDPERYNPEQLLIASAAQCHMMTYFWLAARAGLRVVEYRDEATGTLTVHPDGSGEISRIVLKPEIVISPEGEAGADTELALELHSEVAQYCFIARSLNFAIEHEPTVKVAAV